MNVNKVVVMGRLTYDPEVRQSGNGKSYSRVSVAVNRPRAKDATESAARPPGMSSCASAAKLSFSRVGSSASARNFSESISERVRQ